MAEAIYKVGDILEICGQYGMFSSDKKSRCLVLKCIKPGYEFIVYTLLVLKSDDSFAVIGVNQKDIILSAKQVGHIDISSFLSDNKSNEPDYAMLFAVATIAQVADLRNELDKIKKENEELKAENKALSDTLSKPETKAHLHKIDELENEELKADNAMLKSQIACMEGRIESLVQKRDQLDADNSYLSAKVKHLTINNDRKNGKIGSLQANLAEETLKRKQAEAELDEKTEVLDGIYHSDIVCENNKLKNENKILNEIVNGFKSTCDNCEARSENERLKVDNEKLRSANASFSQKIKCAEKYFDSAAAELYEGREHLSIAQHNISSN